MDPQQTEQLADYIIQLGLTVAAFLATVLHIRIPTLIKDVIGQTLEMRAGSSSPSASADALAPLPARQDCRPWLGTAVLPHIRQLVQQLPEGAETDTWYNDCGEACCASIVAAARGVPVQPDTLRVLYGGQQGSALTTATDLVAILHLCNVAAEAAYWPQSDGMARVAAACVDGRPVICLGRWPVPGGVMHWVLAYRVDASGLHALNPWTGTWEIIPHDKVLVLGANVYVEVLDHLLFEDETPF